MKWLTNIYDPNLKDAKLKSGLDDFEWNLYQRWINKNTIGKPQSNEDYPSEVLESMGFVGVYSTTEE